jgi:transposase
MHPLASGVDMSKASFVGAVWVGGQAHALGKFENTPSGFAALQQVLQREQAAQGAREIHLVVEPTGGYELALVAFAYAQGWLVSLPNPRQVREWAKGIGKRAKTDKVDAQLLAQFAAQQRPPAQPPLAAEVSELDNLLARRSDLETMLRQEKNRLGELRNRPGVPPSVLANLEQMIHALENALQDIEQVITQHLQHHAYLGEHRQRLLTLPGIGPKTVLPLLVLLLRWHTLTEGQGSDKGLTALVGLDPQPYQSGSSVYQRPTISKMGDGEIRRLLYMGALGALRGQNPLHAFYDRLVGRGKAKKLALVAASRKLLTWSWAIFASGTVWNPALFAASV